MTDCADMDCDDCIWGWTYAAFGKRNCSRYKINKEDQIRRKLLKASTS
jgi:hypothetical protein